MAGFESSTLFCPGCEKDADLVESALFCDGCGAPLPESGGTCPHCLGRGLSPFTKILSLSPFRGPIRAAVHRAKYEHRWPLMERLTDRLLRKRDLRSWLDGADALLPVPLHPSRQRERGFNQADVIARRITGQIPKKVIVPAVRVRKTEKQTNMPSPAQRKKTWKERLF